MSWQINSTKPIERVVPGSLCYLVQDGRILLLQRRKLPHIGLWSPPGGKLNPGETPTECILREYYEETGLTLIKPQLRAITNVMHSGLGLQWMLFIYYAQQTTGTLQPSDEGDLEWVALDRLHEYPRPPADIPVLDHVLSGAPVQEMEFRYDPAEQLVETE
jgi:8-oxo-dGTP diphosphatase